ncbi:hypothetical protein DFH06DRAFT_1405380 [Mycena polygramma]|nr:hypothetical protein DFH06DRAFT_1405380 [Mycena polygramma]
MSSLQVLKVTPSSQLQSDWSSSELPSDCVDGPFFAFRGCAVTKDEEVEQILLAAWLGLVPYLSRALRPSQRQQIRSGDVIVWQSKASDNPGLDRLKDGHLWSILEKERTFVVYESKPIRRKPFISFEPGERLYKHTYSARINGDEGKRIWHLVFYYKTSELPHLPQVNVDLFAALSLVPDTCYRLAQLTWPIFRAPVIRGAWPFLCDVPALFTEFHRFDANFPLLLFAKDSIRVNLHVSL